MELTPAEVSQATFRITRKGFEPDEVRRYLTEVSRALEAAQQQSSAMEARARAALAKLHEASQAPQSPSPDEAQAISRALLLAQRTADTTIAEADQKAADIIAAATAQADEARSAAQAESAAMVEASRGEARRARDEEFLRAENEVQALLARRDFLVADVEQLEQHLVTHRERLREVAGELVAIAERSAGGLGDLRRPLLSASDTALHPDGGAVVEQDATAALPAVSDDTPLGDVMASWATPSADSTDPAGIGTDDRAEALLQLGDD
jgi:cell division initiation protein